MPKAKLHVHNARSKIEGLKAEVFKLLSHELAYPVAEPGMRAYPQSDGSVKGVYWDGYARLLQKSGTFPSGLVPRTIRLLRKWGTGVEVRDCRKRPQEAVPRWSFKEGFQLRDYQADACEVAERMTRGVFDSPPRCVSGDARVQVNRAGKTFWITVRDLVHRFNGGIILRGKGSKVRWDSEIPTQIRACDGEGIVRLFDIHRAWDSGEKELVKIRLETGFELSASPDHRVKTLRGWLPLGDVCRSDLVFAELPRGGSVRVPKKNYRFKCGLVGHPFAGRRGRNPDKGCYCVQTHRLVYEAHLNSLPLDQYVRLLRVGPVAGLEFLDPGEFAVHHRDDDPKNNALDNLIVETHTDHWRRHGLSGGWKHCAYQTGPVEVNAIDRAGAGDTYDLEVPGANNFLVDRIVTHNSGKTIMMAEMCRRVADTTVITSPTVPIAKQTYAALRDLLVDHGQGWSQEKPIWDFALLTGGPPKSFKARREVNRAVVFVCTAETAVAMGKEWWRKVRCLMVDERHHQAALKTYGKMNDLAVEAFYRWGFTGTNFRSNPAEQVALEACLGRTVVSYSITDMRDRGVLVPGQVSFRLFESPSIPSSAKFDKVYPRGIVRCDARNAQVASAALDLMDVGRKVLILVHRIEHGERLTQMIPGSRFVQAEDGDDVQKAVAQLDSGHLRCVIGSPVVGEGLDIPSADALVYAKGMKARVTHTQDTFRVLTGDGSKKDAVIVDFVDRHNDKLIAHAVERMRNYVAMGLEVVIDKQGVQRSHSHQLGFGL